MRPIVDAMKIVGCSFLGMLTGLSLAYSLYWILPLAAVYWAILLGAILGPIAFPFRRDRRLSFVLFPIWTAALTGMVSMFFVERRNLEDVTYHGLGALVSGIVLGLALATLKHRRPQTNS